MLDELVMLLGWWGDDQVGYGWVLYGVGVWGAFGID